jgi:uncharacterized protein (TIGR02996 family)
VDLSKSKPLMTTLDALLAGIISEPLEETRWQILADWLQEFDDPRRAELLRLHRMLLATCCEPEKLQERGQWHMCIVEMINSGVRPCVPHKVIELSKGVEMHFSFKPPGSFLMGDEHENPVHRVTLTKGFYLGVYPVTQIHWRAVMGTDPSYFVGIDRPVENVSWNDCQDFCRRLTTLNVVEGEIRLPTEAEWEYVCRAGTTTEYYTGNGEKALMSAGWHDANSNHETYSVGLLNPNAWNLHDMHGNVFEWCRDWFGDYRAEQQTDPLGPVSGSDRIMRGASSAHCAEYARSAHRSALDMPFHSGYLGFRVAISTEGANYPLFEHKESTGIFGK